MLVTIGENRFSMLEVVRIGSRSANEDCGGYVELANGATIVLTATEYAALVKLWDNHAEILCPVPPLNATTAATALPEREFSLGHEATYAKTTTRNPD